MLAKVMYKPIGLAIGAASGYVAGRTFNAAWERRHGTKPPTALTEEATWGQVLGSAVIRASVFAATAAVADRVGARAFRNATGYWPGERRAEPAGRLEPPRS